MTPILIFLLEILAVVVLMSAVSAQAGGMVALTNDEEENLHETFDNLSKKELKSIYGVAKNISHSKGAIVKSEEGEYEYRRSFTSKVELEVNSLQLRSIISAIKENVTQPSFNKSVFLEDLDFLESLVHQYDIGKKFVDFGGFKFILSLTVNKDDEISNTAFVILSAAMQGNREVQKYALTTGLLELINATLHPPLPTRVNSALLTLSAFIRNCPDTLSAFLEGKGIHTLSSVLSDNFNMRKTQLRIIDIFGDITAELFGENDDHSPLLLQLKRTFSADVQLYSVCDRIADVFSTSKEYSAHEKIVAALNTMFELCKDTLKQRQLTHELKILIEQYDPFKPIKVWYSPVMDLELRYYIFQDLKKLHRKLLAYEVSVNAFNTKNPKAEL